MQVKQCNTQYKKMPIISFIITYYNLPLTMLKECVESILDISLSMEEKEIILIDDGSSQNAISYLKEYADSIIYIRQDNAGLSEARNRGLSIAKGEYIQFIDGDDKLITNDYNQCIELLKLHHPDMILFKLTNKEQTILRKDYFKTNGTWYMCNNNIQATACGYIFKKSIVGNTLFTKGIYHEDEEFTPQILLNANSIICTKNQAYYYRERSCSITTRKDNATVFKRINDLKGIINRLYCLSETLCGDKQKALNRRVHQLTMDYIYKIVVEVKQLQFLNKEISDLTQIGLFPLPKHNYTKKYNLFRLTSKYQFGRYAMLIILPLLKKER